MKTLLLDGDILVYKTVFACVDETEWWKVKWTAQKLLERVCGLADCERYLAYLTLGTHNFRLQRATTWPYKGNRPDKEDRPRWYDEVRSYYESLGWQVMRGVEADDALTIAAEVLLPDTQVACATIDKDLKQYPWETFVDLNTDTVYSISKELAHRNLWKQVLIGDKPTDNIPGLSHFAKYQDVGEFDPKVRGWKDLLLGDVGVELLLDSWAPEDYPMKTFELYVDTYDGYDGNTQEVCDVCEEQGIDFGEYRFYETFDLIYMLREAPKDLVINFDTLESPIETKRVHFEFGDKTDDSF